MELTDMKINTRCTAVQWCSNDGDDENNDEKFGQTS